MSAVTDKIYEFEGKQQEIMLYFHDLFVNRLNLSAKLRYKLPFYYGKSWICYLNPTKTGGVELAFTRGNELSNSQGLLDHKGRKQVSSIELQQVKDINQEALLEVIHEAILLDETVPYASKNSSQ